MVEKIAEGFEAELQDQIELIRKHPQIGIQSSRNELVRRVLITKHNALYYLLENDKIILTNIFDTRSSTYPG